MSDRNSEDIIGALYDMVQDARSRPLAADKCILERDNGSGYAGMRSSPSCLPS